MGFAIAEELQNRGADVTLVTGPVSMHTKTKGIKKIEVISAEEMYRACASAEYDIAVMAAAVADYTPTQVADKKNKKN